MKHQYEEDANYGTKNTASRSTKTNFLAQHGRFIIHSTIMQKSQLSIVKIDNSRGRSGK